ncbi:Metal transporter Nramp6 [Gracilariopsis chorda]|uniref:Metal transporter Nramp6 n=1 Tax=Gracilariopsis chorda TaxID=448386 RepID=A0A2V3J4K7_9FLOR|nr:Metal transporter Nramp6 [Gracilariopsis chorda]|eukprot:PXF49052.1 Metal transporter Nramp6 [Gracilariopsis chorda]
MTPPGLDGTIPPPPSPRSPFVSRAAITSTDEHQQRPPRPRQFPDFVTTFGLPCLIAVAAIDPGNLEVDLQAGHALGYTLIWVILFSSILGCVLQALVAHLTICSGKPLATLIAQVYKGDRLLAYSLFAVAEVSVIAFDVAEVVGTAVALQLLFGWPLWFGMLFSSLDTMLVLVMQRKGMTKVEFFIELLLFLLAACLFYELVLSKPDVFSMLQGSVVPSLGSDPQKGAILGVGVLGSVVMSHNLFLHSWLVYDREKSDDVVLPDSTPHRNTPRHMREACHYATTEAAAIFVATFFINACVISITAALPENELRSLVDIGLEDAGALLARVLGGFASTAWAIALLCSGHAATVTGALASQAVCEGFLDLPEEGSFVLVMAVRAVAIIPALAAALIAGEESADKLIVLSQVVLSLALPFAVIPMFKLLISVDRSSRHGIISKKMLAAGYVAFAFLVAANIYVFSDMVKQINELFGCFVAFLTCGIAIFSAYLIVKLIITPVQLTETLTAVEWNAGTNETRPLLTGAEPDNRIKGTKSTT